MQIFNLLNSILDRLEKSIKPHLGSFIRMIPETWTESKSQSLLRIQVSQNFSDYEQSAVSVLMRMWNLQYFLSLPLLVVMTIKSMLIATVSCDKRRMCCIYVSFNLSFGMNSVQDYHCQHAQSVSERCLLIHDYTLLSMSISIKPTSQL